MSKKKRGWGSRPQNEKKPGFDPNKKKTRCAVKEVNVQAIWKERGWQGNLGGRDRIRH